MAKRPLRRLRRGPPVGPAGINWGHSRAVGLEFFAPLSAAHDLRDLVREQRATRTGLEDIIPDQSGALHHLFGTGNYGDFPEVPSRITQTTPFTISWTQEARAASGYGAVVHINFGTAGVDTAFLIYQSVSDSTYYFTAGPRSAGGGHGWSAAVGALTDNRLDRFVLSSAGGPGSTTASDWVLTRNSVLVTRGTSPTFGSNTTAGFRVGALPSGSDVFEGLIGDLRMWSRVLSDEEAEVESTIDGALELYAPRRIWVPVSAGAVTNTLTASLSAAVQASRTATASIAAAVQEQRSAAASAAAAVQQARTTSASVAAAVRQDHTASASIAAAILQARTAAADIAAAVQQGRTASASIAAAVQAARSATASGSAAVQAGASVSASLSAQVQAGSTVAASLDVAVQAARSATAALAGAVQTPRTAQSSIAAAVAAGSSVTASLAAAVREARSAGASISAQVQAGTTIVAQIAAAILESKAASAAIAAAVAAARSTSAAIAAAVAQQHTVSATLAAAVRSGRVASAAVSAYISAPGDHTVSPRLYLVDPQDRAYLIDPEDRTYIVPASSRSTTA